MINKVQSFSDFNNSENMYKVNDEGQLEKQDYEYYKDHHPQKFLYNSDSESKLFESDTVWVIKHHDKIIATFDGQLDETLIQTFFEKLS